MRFTIFFRWLLTAYAISALTAGLITAPAHSQTTGFAIGEAANTKSAPELPSPLLVQQADGPVRLAHFSFLQGDVTWRPDESLDWSPASINQPVEQGAQIAVEAGGRAEIQFDDGGYLRLGGGAVATVQLLFSDSEGEFTELRLTAGLASLRLRHGRSVYQVDTPLVSVKTDGPARLRIGISDGVEVAMREGAAVVEGAKGKVTAKAGDYLDLRNESAAYVLLDLPPDDSWERWNDDRDQLVDVAAQSLERHQLPPNVALVAGNLDAYGTWRTDALYGQVWCPRIGNASWRPYFAGHWVRANPFGWTWCSDEAWGWAPYHYGAWFHAIYGWAWKPGPIHQYWSPAVVHFIEHNGNIAWCPLSPDEIRYPAGISVGVLGEDWPYYFSIGAAGCYYPAGANYCVGKPFTLGHSVRAAVPGTGAQNTSVLNNGSNSAGKQFIPLNARSAAGVTVATESAFANHGPYTPLIAGSTNVFLLGHVISASLSDHAAMFGPTGIKPTNPLDLSKAPVQRNIDIGAVAARAVFSVPVPKDPVHTGIVATRGVTGGAGGGAGIVHSSAAPIIGRAQGSASDAAVSYRSIPSSGRGTSPASPAAGSAPAGSNTGGGGYIVGRPAAGGTPGGSAGGPVVGAPPVGSSAGAGSNSSPGSSPPRAPASSTGGYHVGGGTPSNGTPVHR